MSNNITAQDVFKAVENGEFDGGQYEYEVIEYVDTLTDIGVMQELKEALELNYFNADDDTETKIAGYIDYIIDGVMQTIRKLSPLHDLVVSCRGG